MNNTNHNLTDSEFENLKAAKTEKEWNQICDGIKAARSGQYPPDWWPRMALSGIINTKMMEFEASKNT